MNFIMDYKVTLRLKLEGFNASEREKLDSVLALAEYRLDRLWELHDSREGADVLLFRDLDMLKGPYSLPVIYYVTAAVQALGDDPMMRALEVDDNQVPRMGQLIHVCNELAQLYFDIKQPSPERVDQRPVISEPSPPPLQDTTHSDRTATEDLVIDEDSGNDVKVYDSPLSQPQSVSFLDYIQSDFTGYVVLRFEHHEKIYIDAEKGFYYSQISLESLAECIRLNVPYVHETVADTLFKIDLERNDLQAQPIAHLRWYAALCTPSDHLLTELKGQTVSLKRWPDLGLPGCKQLIHLAAFMQSNQATIDSAAKATNTPLSVVCCFVNASALEGLVQYGNVESIHKKTLKPELKSLLSSISSRINF